MLLRENDVRENEFLLSAFGKYRGEEWQLIENTTANLLGFMIFENSVTKSFDIVSVTNEPVNSKHKLNYGKSLLGNIYSDIHKSVVQDKKILS